jgi:hypothetical protein
MLGGGSSGRVSHDLPYDDLILALGSSTNYFGLPGVENYALTVKLLGDAIVLRNRLITDLEEASSECAAGEQPSNDVRGGGWRVRGGRDGRERHTEERIVVQVDLPEQHVAGE